MRRAIETVDRWGPAALSVVTLFLLAGSLWLYTEKVARLEGQVIALQNQINTREDIQKQIADTHKWMIAVYERGFAAGVKMPEVPKIEVKLSDKADKDKYRRQQGKENRQP